MKLPSIGISVLLSLFVLIPFESGADIAAEFDYNNLKHQEAPVNVEQNFKDSPAHHYHEFQMMLERNKLIQCGILSATAIISLLIVLWFITNTNYSANHIVNASGLVLIIFGTINLVILARADEQLTAAIGIMGAIAGYLFGTMRRGDGGEKQEPGRTVAKS